MYNPLLDAADSADEIVISKEDETKQSFTWFERESAFATSFKEFLNKNVVEVFKSISNVKEFNESYKDRIVPVYFEDIYQRFSYAYLSSDDVVKDDWVYFLNKYGYNISGVILSVAGEVFMPDIKKRGEALEKYLKDNNPSKNSVICFRVGFDPLQFFYSLSLYEDGVSTQQDSNKFEIVWEVGLSKNNLFCNSFGTCVSCNYVPTVGDFMHDMQNLVIKYATDSEG